MERIRIVSNTDYICYAHNNHQTRVETRYSNGIDLYRTGWQNQRGYLLEYDVDDAIYVLSEYEVGIRTEEDRRVDEIGMVEIAKFYMTQQKLEILVQEKIDEMGSNYSSAAMLPVFMFLKVAYNNAENGICGQKVWELFVRIATNLPNAYKNMVLYYDHMESLEKLGVSMFFTIGKQDFQIQTDVSERHKVLSVPKQVLAYIDSDQDATTYNRETYIDAFRSMSNVDPNELIAVIDYFKLYDQITKKISHKYKTYNYGSIGNGCKSTLVCCFAEIKKLRPDIDLRKLLNYLIKQQFWRWHSSSNCNVSDCERMAIEIPSTIAGIYRDYLKLGPTDLFPQHLQKSHNVLAIESKIVFSNEEKQKFAEYGIQLAKELDRDVDGFVFSVPTDYDEFVRIGKTFQNCLPSCGDSFYRGMCDIVFIYRAREDTPKYAIELNKQRLLVQAKTTRDLDITDADVLKAIEKYERMIQKEQRKESKNNGYTQLQQAYIHG